MKTMPAIGTRVKFRHESKWCGVRECTGTVMAQYRGGERCRDHETGEWYTTPDHVGVKVDEIPKWWPYPGKDRFAPDISELEPLP